MKRSMTSFLEVSMIDSYPKLSPATTFEVTRAYSPLSMWPPGPTEIETW